MENIAKKILSDIAEQLKPLIENKLYDPFFLKRKNKWRFVIEPTKPSFESLRFDLFQSQNGENSDLTLAVQSIENHELVFKIFKEVKNLSNKRTTTIIHAAEYIAFTWKLNLSSSLECNEFLKDSPIFFKEFFIMIQHLGLVKLKKHNELFDLKNRTYAYTRKKKTPKKSTKSRIQLIRKTRPAIQLSVKSYFYLN